MAIRTAASRFLDVFDGIGAAFAAAGAVRNHRQPDPRHLERLGIDPKAFERIGRFY